jgi:hypothetical protein
MKTALLAFGLLACASASAVSVDKDFSPTTVLGDDLEPLGTLAISDLLPDTAYGSSGSRSYDFNDAGGKLDVALRVFPASGGGYWLAGWHGGATTARYLVVVKLLANGGYDTSYGGGTGKKIIPTTMLSVVDVAKGIGDALYFVGTRHTGSNTDTDFQIDCVDNTGAPCAGFGTNGTQGYWLDLGADVQNKDDIPARIVWFASQIYVVGETDTGSGTTENRAAFAVNVNPSNGNQNLSFGNVGSHPGVYLFNPDFTPNGRDAAYDVLAYAPAPFQYRLLIVGETQHSTAGGEDTDGFVVSVNGATGHEDGFMFTQVYADLGTKHKDKLLRVMQRRNGGFVVAGTAMDDSTSPAQFQLLMAAYKADGAFDAAFGMRHSLVISNRNIPYAIAERADTRDLVVGVNVNADLFGDGHAMQGVVQIGRNGDATQLHALGILDFGAHTDAEKGSSGTDLFVDSGNRVVTAGWRCWTTAMVGPLTVCNDEDMTAGRFIANDTIFADAFGGSSSD